MIDAHQHVWQVGSSRHEWPPPHLTAIHRDFLMADWRAAALAVGFEGSVLVQAQPNEEETRWLLELAARDPAIKAVVGWTDLQAPDAPARVSELARHEKLRGLRPMLQSLPDGWIGDRAIAPAIEAMIDHRLTFDALVVSRHLPELRGFAERWPQLRIVIDHGAKPPIAFGEIAVWSREMGSIAALPNVWCKLSGLLTEMGPKQATDVLVPYVRLLCSLFGPERLMWGSDWPVILLAGELAEWHALAAELSAFDAAGLGQLFGGTAARFYGIAPQ